MIIINNDGNNLAIDLRDNGAVASSEIHIQKNVFIGDHVTILKGVTIGENSVIGNHSVVTKSIPANVIAAGNPAKVIKQL
jgi:maltose O-acetyltransferase